MRIVGGCYLLHFESPVPRTRAQHYLGWSVNIARRVRLHFNGRGARLVRQALKAGIGVELVRVWPDALRQQERTLKRRVPKSYCPKCRSGSRGCDDDLLSLVLVAVRGTRRRAAGTWA
jgi:predicted GIY-YIG superfamily endonuclease